MYKVKKKLSELLLCLFVIRMLFLFFYLLECIDFEV